MIGTKAQTLEYLQERLYKSKICKITTFRVGEYSKDPQFILDQVCQIFPNTEVIIRSSAPCEDTKHTSMAGYFTSLLNIKTDPQIYLKEAVDRVIEGYLKDEGLLIDDCQILVQPMLRDVSMSGVVFTRDINSGAPYYVINYDDESGKTDTITGGVCMGINKTVLVFRDKTDRVSSPRLQRLLDSIQEIEAKVGPTALDIEFAETSRGDIYIFQVRPLTTQQNWDRSVSRGVTDAVHQIECRVKELNRPRPMVAGRRTILGQMPDWNPAEMIGSKPRPLALSLYQSLITNKSWRIARVKMGYNPLPGCPLMVSLAGQPFIDTRASFNSFLPADLPHEIGDRLVDHWLDRLEESPEHHDKIEFKIASTVYTPNFETYSESHLKDVLNHDQLKTYKNLLLALTNRLVSGDLASMSRLDQKISRLKSFQDRNHASTHEEADPFTMNAQFETCIRWGIIPFSQYARHGFIAKSFLDSLVSHGILDEDDVLGLIQNTETITSTFLRDIEKIGCGELDDSAFMDKYGHLRSGTYDILAMRYDQKNLCDFVSDHSSRRPLGRHENLKPRQMQEIDRLFDRHGIALNAKALFAYVRKAIQGREYTKFIFTRSVSDGLEMIARWGERIGLSREELSFLTFNDIFDAQLNLQIGGGEGGLRSKSRRNEETHRITQSLRLPHLIRTSDDVVVVPMLRTVPTFITHKNVQGRCVVLDGRSLSPSVIAGSVVVIESADPGFDWVFSHPIKGLITKYGGANSHMAIRCAELNLPAAIGCGPQVFDRLLKSQRVCLKCSEEMILPLVI